MNTDCNLSGRARLKRSLDMNEDLVVLPGPDEPGASIFVIVLSYPVYFPCGSYGFLVWDEARSRPAIMLLNHTLFSSFRRLLADTAHDLREHTLEVMAETKPKENPIVYHNLYNHGHRTIITDEMEVEIWAYVGRTFQDRPKENDE
jgi:hypothetical protein